MRILEEKLHYCQNKPENQEQKKIMSSVQTAEEIEAIEQQVK